MSNLSYDIIKWDGIIFEGSIEPQPYIVINPDTNLLDLTSINGNKILVKVNGTNSKYDNNNGTYIAVLINKNTLLLKTKWHGEPKKMGKIIIELYKNTQPDNTLAIADNFNWLYSLFIYGLILCLIFYILIKLNK
jgi:hypothetical protein